MNSIASILNQSQLQQKEKSNNKPQVLFKSKIGAKLMKTKRTMIRMRNKHKALFQENKRNLMHTSQITNNYKKKEMIKMKEKNC